MRKIIYAILFSIFFVGCASTNIEKKSKISSDNKRLETFTKKLPYYDILVERGFDIHSLDYVKNKSEFFDALDPYFYNYEDGSAIDCHFYGVGLKHVKFSNEYGTKDELLKKGYVENETMFYYPSNGEKDWRVGEWTSKYEYTSQEFKERDTSTPWFQKNDITSCGFYDYKNYILLKIYEHPKEGNDYKEFMSRAKNKDIIIIDVTQDKGGYPDELSDFLLTLKNKKIFVLITDDTCSYGEIFASYLRRQNPHIKLIGTDTFGAAKYSRGEELYKFPKLGFSIYMPSCLDNNYPQSDGLEGIGVLPDYWAYGPVDIVKTLNWALNNGENHKSSTSLFNFYKDVIPYKIYDIHY